MTIAGSEGGEDYPKRSIKLTEKGRLFQLEGYTKKRNLYYRRLVTKSDRIGNVSEWDSLSRLQEAMTEYHKLHKLVEEYHEHSIAVALHDEVDSLEEWWREKDEAIFDFKKRVIEHMAFLKQNTKDDDNQSRCSSQTSSSRKSQFRQKSILP